jgi:hypothetical protein
MSYSEQDGQVVLTMSREDYSALLCELRLNLSVSHPDGLIAERLGGLLDRLNSGNPHYTPYQVEKEKP